LLSVRDNAMTWTENGFCRTKPDGNSQSERNIKGNAHRVLSRERRKRERGTADRTIELPRNNKKRRTKCTRGTRGKSQEAGCQMTVTMVYRIRSFKSPFFQLHCHSQNSPMYRSVSNKAISTNRTATLRATIKVT